jgi:hypothetical protein
VGCVPKRKRYIYCLHVKAFTHMRAQVEVDQLQSEQFCTMKPKKIYFLLMNLS